MMKTEKMITSPSKEKKYKKWEKSITKDGITKSIRVEEAENGFVVRMTEYTWEDSYKESCKVYISTSNPLEKESPLKEEEVSIIKAIAAFNKDFE